VNTDVRRGIGLKTAVVCCIVSLKSGESNGSDVCRDAFLSRKDKRPIKKGWKPR
jgi:hypothetical protein